MSAGTIDASAAEALALAEHEAIMAAHCGLNAVDALLAAAADAHRDARRQSTLASAAADTLRTLAARLDAAAGGLRVCAELERHTRPGPGDAAAARAALEAHGGRA